MARRKQLSKKQLTVIEDMFSGQFNEQAVLDRHKISRNVYNKWLADERFVEQFNQRIASAHRQSAALIARYAPLAAAKLVQLTESEKEETARKACLDIISFPKPSAERSEQLGQPDGSSALQSNQLTPETAGKLLALLAEEERQ